MIFASAKFSLRLKIENALFFFFFEHVAIPRFINSHYLVQVDPQPDRNVKQKTTTTKEEEQRQSLIDFSTLLNLVNIVFLLFYLFHC